MQHQHVHRVTHPGNHAARQGGLCLGQGVDLLARVPGLALAKAHGRLIKRHVKAIALHATGLVHRLVICGQHAVGATRGRFDAIGLQGAHHPAALLVLARNAQAAYIAAQTGKHGAGPLAVLDPGVPGLVQRVLRHPGQITPVNGHPAALGRYIGGKRRLGCSGRPAMRSHFRHRRRVVFLLGGGTSHQGSYNQRQ